MSPTERAGKPPVHTLCCDHDGKDDGADAQCPAVGVPEMGGDHADPVQRRAVHRRKAEEIRQLVDDDDDGHPCQKAGDDRGGQELRDPPQAEEADEGHQHSDHHRQDADEVDVVRGAGRRQVGDPHCEEWSDGGVGADGHLWVRTEQSEDHRARHEGVKAGHRRHAGEAGSGQLFGDSDHEQRDRSEQIRRCPGSAIPVQR